jgi:hypothetical protein
MSSTSLPQPLPLAPARRHFSAELWLVAAFAAVWAVGIILGLPGNFPDARGLRLAQRHYFGPLLLAAVLQLGVSVVAVRRNLRRGQTDPFVMLRLLPFMLLVLLLHFNFKAWMPLVNGRLYDDAYQGIDLRLAPVVDSFLAARTFVAAHAPFNVNPLYHGLFVGMFFLSTSVHALADTPRRQREFILGLCLILLLGGVGYWAAPAVGPFVHRQGLNPISVEVQRGMLAMFDHVRETRSLPPGYFAAPPAAMPSLHIGHALFMLLFAVRSARWLALLYVPVFGWFVVESVAAGWHYLIDLPVGAALAIFCLWLTPRLVRGRDSAPQQQDEVPQQA